VFVLYCFSYSRYESVIFFVNESFQWLSRKSGERMIIVGKDSLVSPGVSRWKRVSSNVSCFS